MGDKDYLAHLEVEEGDAEQHGVKGMKWGVRRSSAQLRSAAAKRASEGEKKDHLSTAKSGESAASRYARLKAQAKAGGAHDMSDDDLKFFNARTEALAKVAKLNERKPGWLSETSKTIVQKTAQRQMQSIADAMANKHISGPIVERIGTHITKEAAAKAVEEAKKAASKG